MQNRRGGRVGTGSRGEGARLGSSENSGLVHVQKDRRASLHAPSLFGIASPGSAYGAARR